MLQGEGVLQGDPPSETDRSSELRRELIGSHVPQHSVLSQLPRSQTTTTRMKLVGNFEALGAFIQTLHMLIWYCIYLRAFFFKCVCRQCPVCPNVYSRLRMFSCLPIPPTRVPLPSECLFLHRSFQEDFRALRSLFTLLRCHYN